MTADRKLALTVVVGLLIISPFVAMMSQKAVRGHKNRVEDWLPITYQETQELGWFRHRFVADQFVIVSWEGCELGATAADDDPRIAKLTAELEKATLRNSDALAFQSVTNGRTTLDQLVAADIPMPTARERLAGTLIGVDGKQTCVMAVLSDDAVPVMKEVIAAPRPATLIQPESPLTPLYKAISDAGLDPTKVHLGGPPVDNVAIDEEGQKTLANLAILSGGLGIALAYWALRSIRMTALVFVCGLGSSSLALAMIPLTGGSMDAIMMSMPALVYVLGVSDSLHYLAYYKTSVREKGVEHAAMDAAKHAIKPSLLCSVTTALGLMSLLVSDITPIRRFGFYSALGVMLSLVVLFTVLPAVLTLWPWRPKMSPTTDEAPESPFWHRYAMGVQRHYGKILFLCIAIIIGLACGLPQTTTSIDLLKLFSDDAQLLKDYRWYEDKLGKLVPAELVVRFPTSALRESLPETATPRTVASSFTMLERLELVRRIEATIRQRLGAEGEDLVGATMSAATFAQTPENSGGLGNSGRRYAINEELIKAWQRLSDTGFLRKDPVSGEELWRITVRCAAFNDGERDEVVGVIREVVAPLMAGNDFGVQTLSDLSQFDGEATRAPKIAIYAPAGIEDDSRAAGELLRNRGLRLAVLSHPLSEATEAETTALKEQDVVLAYDATEPDLEALRKLGVTVKVAKVMSADGPVKVVYTGVLPIVYKAQRELLNSLVESTWWSFGTILPLMIFMCRSFWGGILVMLPNVLPVLLVFGGMAWIGMPVDIGSMMAASIALGIAVDDTIHFLAWYREDVTRLGNRESAIIAAFERSATPTLQGGLVNGLGLSVFAVSTFIPTQRFGLLMLVILVAGIVAELVLLPALLFSPLGRVFDPPKTLTDEPESLATELTTL
jgi:predicted RND superfamily exporter protein